MTAEHFSVQTAQGVETFAPADGHVLPHEHITIDLRVWWEGEGEWSDLDDACNGLTSESLFAHRHKPQGTSRENLVLSDWYVSAKELRKARDYGCQLVVDLTSHGLNPVPEVAARAAQLAGLSLVLSVGRYIDPALSESDKTSSPQHLAEKWLASMESRPAGQAVGIIGEIGTSAEVTNAEKVSLTAAALVQKQSGLPINVHLHPFAAQGHIVLDVLETAGARLDKVALSHCDAQVDIAALSSLAQRGAYVEFDLFGTDHEWRILGQAFPSDRERVHAICALVEQGLGERVLMSHDICMKNELTRYGGWGYEHLGRNVLPTLTRELGSQVVTTLSSRNPLRLLAVNG